MAFDESKSRLVIVGEDGSAHKAKTSQQLAAALSVSVWDISNLHQPLLVCTAGSKQVNLSMAHCMCAYSFMSSPLLQSSVQSITLPHLNEAC